MYNTLVVPTDGSPGARAALEHAIELAGVHDATIFVVSVVDAGLTHAEPLLEELRATADEALHDAEIRAVEAGIGVETDRLEGSPPEEIVEYASAADADLIVMGTHGRTGLDRVLLGSVAERVVRNAPVPVLTVRTSDE